MSEETEAQTASTEGNETTETPQESTPTSYMEGRFDSVSALEAGLTTSEKRYEDYRSMNDKRFGSFVGAPEAYEMNEGLNASESLQAYARENQFSNEALNGLVEFHNNDRAKANETYFAEQKEALGTDAEARLTNVQDWAKANLGTEVMDTFKGMINSAKSVEMFEKIMKMNNGTAPAQVASPKSMVSKDELHTMRYAKNEFGERKMSDPAYHAKVTAMEKELRSN